MPTEEAEAREDEVLDIVIDLLCSEGRSVSLLDRPDRNPARSDGLTVDAELEIDDKRWALDIMTLRWRPQLEREVNAVKRLLDRELRSELDRRGCTLVLFCHPTTEARGLRALAGLAGSALHADSNYLKRGDESARIVPRTNELDAIEIRPWLSRTTTIRLELATSPGGAIAKKLARQFATARRLGCETVLVIDQVGAPDLTFGGNFLPSPDGVLAAVADREQENGIRLDALVLVDMNNNPRWLRSPL